MSLLTITLAQICAPQRVCFSVASPSQREYMEMVFSAIYQPMTIQQIAEHVGMSEKTVKRYIAVMLKTGDAKEAGEIMVQGLIGKRKKMRYVVVK